MAIAYIDYSQQEFGVAASLSGDDAMMEAYRSGDPYLAFAKQSGAIPSDATEEPHKLERTLYKVCCLGIQHGMGEAALARHLDKSAAVGRELLQQHREAYPNFWRWSESKENLGLIELPVTTVFGWQHNFDRRIGKNPRSLSNHFVQASRAEILRMACCLAAEQGIRLCCMVHDAVLIEAPISTIEKDVARTQECFSEASRLVLGDFELRSDKKIVCYPDRYKDQRGETIWKEVMSLLEETHSVGK